MSSEFSADSGERQADAMADQVMQGPVANGTVNLKPASGNHGASQSTAPAGVQKTLQSAGQPMDATTLGFMQDRFHHNFSHVRIHNDATAHQSSAEIQAQAYTHGHHVAFREGRYNPSTNAGRHLLAHELTHVVQQSKGTNTVQRKIEVIKPDDKIPNPKGTGLDQTNGQTVVSYMKEICADASPSINKGNIELDQTFCTGTTKDAKANTVSKISKSKTPDGCACACDMVNSANTFKITISDTVDPFTAEDNRKLARTTGTGASISVASPNGKTFPVVSKAGNVMDTPPWLVLAHELCGHASAINKGKALDDFNGNATTGRGEHTPAVTIENKIRAEHGLEERGTHRDPCCGAELDGVVTNSGSKNCKDFLTTKKAHDMMQDPATILFECQKWRDEYNILNGTSFTLEQTVTEKKDEKLPTEFRNDVFFNIDTPQPWFNPAASFGVSVTADGKLGFEEAVAIIDARGDIKKIQLEGYASKDKPANDPDYNTRLVKRRVDLVKSEMLKRGVAATLFTSFQPTVPGKTCTEIEAGSFNCSDTESKAQVDPKDRKVVIRYTRN
ncbi:eCIS core domain-containing protein [Chryseolinea lacunae]|uniref:DUF4157 domain-containing protein n=1 Tax=Chryseolinea lacunae TaxID=2801331 RepID=A0ABS1KPD8_9BACT|nr:DUF4157 domain-containing protein [Chryseolinea lacunae]MBL0741122.1 DUF4157 domain-containing protein [Chryseolinea lacunae]